MSQPWSSYREIVFDILLDRGKYIGYGRFLELRARSSSTFS